MHSDTPLPRVQLIGLALVMVAIFGVVFALGYRLGRSQPNSENHLTANEETRHSEKGLGDAVSARPSAEPQSKDKSDEVADPRDSGEPAPSGVTETQSNAAPGPRGTILLQVAAVTKEGDATALAQSLQQEGFPTFVRPPVDDRYYRVQLGPYQDFQSADIVVRKLESAGYKAIIKRLPTHFTNQEHMIKSSHDFRFSN